MFDNIKNPSNIDPIVEHIPYDYEGISKILAQFVELYKVVENKKILDEGLKYFIQPKVIIHNSI